MHKCILVMHIKRLLALCLLLLCAQTYAKDRVQIVEENAPAVVAVNVLRSDGSVFTGTGFVITSNGIIATSLHVLQKALLLNITFNTGVVSGQAVPFAVDEKTDLALLKIAAWNLPAVTLGNSDSVLPGQEITVIGNPRRLQNTVSSGLISQVRKQADGILWHQISAPISPSSSGSPVFNEQGEVISVAFASVSGEENQNLNFAIPSNYVMRLLQDSGYSHFIAMPTEEPPSKLSLWQRFVEHIKLSWKSLYRLFHHNR